MWEVPGDRRHLDRLRQSGARGSPPRGHIPPDDVGDLRALLVEILIAFILVFVVISVATDERVPAGVAPWRSASPSPAAC